MEDRLVKRRGMSRAAAKCSTAEAGSAEAQSPPRKSTRRTPRLCVSDLPVRSSPARKTEVCVSYAWNEEYSSDPENALKVQQFCDALAAAGRMVVRDTTHMKLGDRISEFMRRIGEADRIHVFLSDSYLKSPYCMYELLQIWERSHDAEDFRRRTRVFPMLGTDISSPAARTKYAVYWKQQYDEMGESVRQYAEIISPAEFENWHRIHAFAQKVSAMLVEINDVLLTGDLSEYIAHALRELGEAE